MATEDAARRTERVQVMLTRAELAQLDGFATAKQWTRSKAAQVLIAEGLARENQEGA